MKSLLLKNSMLALLFVTAISCNDGKKETVSEMETALEASEMAHEYKVDTASSEIKWEGSKPTATHHGTIMLSSGTFSVHEGAVEAGNFVIDMNTIVDLDLEGSDKTNLENHLKGTVEGKEGDFFNVKEYPTATFELTSVQNDMVKGNLTMKGKTNAIEFPAKVVIDGDLLNFKSEPIELDRTKWGVNFGSKSVFPDLGDKFVSDTMILTISLMAKKA